MVVFVAAEAPSDLRPALRDLARHPKVFTPFYLAMVRVGEMTGRLEEVFLRLTGAPADRAA